MSTESRAEVLLIGGRAGVGKSTVAWEVSSARAARYLDANAPDWVHRLGADGRTAAETAELTGWARA